MADASLRDEFAGFLDDCVAGLTIMHVKAAQYQNEPHDQTRVEALARIPGGLIERAQNLKARLDADSAPAPKAAAAKSKPATKR